MRISQFQETKDVKISEADNGFGSSPIGLQALPYRLPSSSKLQPACPGSTCMVFNKVLQQQLVPCEKNGMSVCPIIHPLIVPC